MDFHELGDFLAFHGNEAGPVGAYMNGGIWPHGNAWYALALLAAGEGAEAAAFVRDAMTVNGIARSPNGQPAMYEYRRSDRAAPSTYGKIDKPQFLWAAGWYLYDLYQLLGVRETPWNLALAPAALAGGGPFQYSLVVGGRRVTVRTSGSGRHLHSIRHGRAPYPSAVIPRGRPAFGTIRLESGTPRTPYVASTSSALAAADLRGRALCAQLEAFAGHRNVTRIVSPWPAAEVRVDGRPLRRGWTSREDGGAFLVEVTFLHAAARAELTARF